MTRKQLLEEARKPEHDRSGHLHECPECAEAVRLLAVFPVSGRIPLAEPPAGWVTKARRIPSGSVNPARSFVERAARLIFDSWASPQPVGVRGQATLGQRRISFEVDRVRFDLRAEKHTDEWRFVAQATAPGSSTGELTTDGRAVLPDQDGIYQWSAPRPPRKISLRLDDVTVAIPELKWTRPRTKKRPSDS